MGWAGLGGGSEPPIPPTPGSHFPEALLAALWMETFSRCECVGGECTAGTLYFHALAEGP